MGQFFWSHQKYFNPHFRKGSDWYTHTATPMPQISIHTSAREVTYSDRKQDRHWQFQSTLPQGKWHPKLQDCFIAWWFQSTLPQGKWPQAILQICRKDNFNPHFRKGSDVNLRNHSPLLIHFNPHFRKGSDDADQAKKYYQSAISIHTSAREVTQCCCIICRTVGFQSTLPQGKWRKSDINLHIPYAFQSTLPQGKWRLLLIKKLRFLQFQSTLPQGKWQYTAGIIGIILSFQSTLPQGKWRRSDHLFRSARKISIHTSAREVTLPAKPPFISSEISIHTSAREVTPVFSDFPHFLQISIHTSAREVT